MPGQSGPIGLDGLTTATLRTSRAGWWDDAFTTRLLAVIPTGARAIVDVGCGLGQAAHAVLPHRPDATYLGIDADPARVEQARAELAGHAGRAAVEVGTAEGLPVDAATADVVLYVMTLQHLRDPVAALREAIRIARPGGCVVAAEPDNAGARWYFAGELARVTARIGELTALARAARRPADSSIGPYVAGLMVEVGLAAVTATVHAVHATRLERRDAFAERVGRVVDAIAVQAGLGPDSEPVAACRAALAAELAGPDRVALGSHVVPVFVTTGTTGG